MLSRKFGRMSDLETLKEVEGSRDIEKERNISVFELISFFTFSVFDFICK